MDLLEILFGNFAFIMGLLWILGSIFGQGKKKEQSTKHRPSKPQPIELEPVSPSSFDPPPLEPEPVRSEPMGREYDLEPVQPASVEETHVPPLTRQKDQLQLPIFSQEPVTFQMADSKGKQEIEPVSFSKASGQKEMKVPHPLPQLSSPVVQGVIWSEILGPPRGRQPRDRRGAFDLHRR